MHTANLELLSLCKSLERRSKKTRQCSSSIVRSRSLLNACNSSWRQARTTRQASGRGPTTCSRARRRCSRRLVLLHAAQVAECGHNNVDKRTKANLCGKYPYRCCIIPAWFVLQNVAYFDENFFLGDDTLFCHYSKFIMGNESSTLSDGGSGPRVHDDNVDAQTLDAASCGFRVLGIQEQSPASRAGFVSFFDFILEANGIRLVRCRGPSLPCRLVQDDACVLLKLTRVLCLHAHSASRTRKTRRSWSSLRRARTGRCSSRSTTSSHRRLAVRPSLFLLLAHKSCSVSPTLILTASHTLALPRQRSN